jgi:imidazolonepropionase-like amidohydrolase
MRVLFDWIATLGALAILAAPSCAFSAEADATMQPQGGNNPTSSGRRSVFQPYAPPATGIAIYRGVNLIDGRGGAVQADMAVVVDGANIKAVVPRAELSVTTLNDAEIIDLQGLYILPGLIDTHVHLATPPNRKRAEAMLRRDIFSGVTAVRDMADDLRALGDLARSARVGEIAASDIYYAALMAGAPFFADRRTLAVSQGANAGAVPWMQSISTQTDLPLAVAMARGTSATAVKLYADLSGPLVAKITAEGHRQGMLVWAHGMVFPATPKEVVEAGVDVVSHSCLLGYAVSVPPPLSARDRPVLDYAKLADRDNAEMAALFREMRRRGTILDATNYVYVQTEKELAAQSGRRPICSGDLSARLTAQAYREGVLISTGTDEFSPPEDPYPSLHDELIFLADKVGMPPAQVIRSATVIGAMTIGQQAQMGTIEPGKLANFVAVSGNPLDDLHNLRTVVLTVKRGVRYARSDYRPITSDEVVEEDD